MAVYVIVRFSQYSHPSNKSLGPDTFVSFRRTFRLTFLGFTAASIHEVDTGILPLRHMKNVAESGHLSLMDTGLGYFIISDSLSSLDQSDSYWKTQIYILIMGILRILINLCFTTADKEEYGPYWNSFLTILLVRFLNLLVKPLKWAQKILCVGVLMGLNQMVLSLYPQSPLLRLSGPWAAVLGYFPLYTLTKIVFKIAQDYTKHHDKYLRKQFAILILFYYYFLHLLSQTGVNAHLMSPSTVLLLLLTTHWCWLLTISCSQDPVPPVRGRQAFLSANILTGMYKILNPRGIYFPLFEVLYFGVLMLCLSHV